MFLTVLTERIVWKQTLEPHLTPLLISEDANEYDRQSYVYTKVLVNKFLPFKNRLNTCVTDSKSDKVSLKNDPTK